MTVSIVSSFFYTERVVLLRNTIDDALYNKDLQSFLKNISLFFVFLILTIALDLFAEFISSINDLSLFNSFRKKLMNLLVNSSMMNLKKQNTGQMITRLFDDIWNVTDLYSQIIPDIISSVFRAGLLACSFFQLSPKIFLMALILTPLYSFPISVSKKKIMEHQDKERWSFERSVKSLNETLNGISVLKTFEIKKTFQKEFGKRMNDWFNDAWMLMKVLTRAESFFPLLNGLLPIIVIATSSIFVVRDEITIGSAISFYYFVGGFYSLIGGIYDSVLTAMRSKTYRNRILEILQFDAENGKSKELKRFEEMYFQNVSFGYSSSEREFLSSLHFKLSRGDKVAIVGSSGAGKSTFVSLFNRFLSPTKGKIFINGISIEEYSLSSLRKNIIVVHSNDYLFDTSIRNNITLFEDFPEKEINRVLEICECRFVKDMENGIDTVIGEKGIKLSEGQRQRIILARALIRKPQILILDEITSGIDSETEERILERILKEIDTVVIISHRLSTIRKAQKIYVMDNGCFVDSGTHDELMEKSSTYRKIVENQLTT